MSGKIVEIVNDVQNPCLKKMVDAILNNNLNNNVNIMIQGVFGGNSTLDLTFTDKVPMDDPVHDGEEKGTFDNNNNLIKASIRLNANVLASSSQEYTVATIMHEALHAYLDSKGMFLNDPQHDVMAANYVTTMANDLMAMFPNLNSQQAYSLAWGGLENTHLYNNPGLVYMPPYQKDINTLYRFHTDSSGHHFGHDCN